MKRIKLCETAYIDITDEQFENNKSFNVIDKSTGKFLFEAKRVRILHTALAWILANHNSR